MGLCFRFVMKTVSTLQGCKPCWAFSASHAPPPASRERGREGTQLGQLTATDQRCTPCHMTSCSAIKAGEEEGSEEHVCSDGVYLPKSLSHMIKPCFPGGGWTSACQWEAVNEFVILLLLCLLNCLYLSPQVSSLLPFQFFPPSHCGAELPAGVKPQHWEMTFPQQHSWFSPSLERLSCCRTTQ